MLKEVAGYRLGRQGALGERTPNATFLIGNDKTLKQALEAKQIGNAMCFSCGNDSTNEERSKPHHNPVIHTQPR